ncbi:MAG TPA: ATP-binding protein [Blastocatellia bacterium]|nr:ATP-binding protein [Blastocatellia bacterium]
MPETVTAPDYVRPQIAPHSHPIETTHYVLATNPMDDFCQTILRWTRQRCAGGLIYGAPRRGKTRAVRYLVSVLPELLGISVPIISFTCRDYKQASEGIFFQDLLKGVGHLLPEKGSPSAKRDRLIEFLAEKVQSSGQDRLILIIDEAQKLHETHYKWLIDVHNELDARDISLVVLLVGQDELAHQYSAFKLAKKTQILGRFMVNQFCFHGILSAADVGTCLKGYDKESEYPDDSGWSFTRYYFPAAFQNGFRLEKFKDVVWQAFKETKGQHGLPGPPEIPMYYFCRSVESVLTEFSSLEEDEPLLSLRTWQQAVINSGFVDAERYVTPLEE